MASLTKRELQHVLFIESLQAVWEKKALKLPQHEMAWEPRAMQWRIVVMEDQLAQSRESFLIQESVRQAAVKILNFSLHIFGRNVISISKEMEPWDGYNDPFKPRELGDAFQRSRNPIHWSVNPLLITTQD